MKFFLTTILTSFIITSFGQQTNCAALKIENDNLKNLLGLYSNHKKDTADKIEFSLFQIKGNIKKQTITVEILVKNSSPINRQIIIKETDIIDEQTNSHNDGFVSFGADGLGGLKDILTNVSRKFTIEIKGVAPATMNFVKNINLKLESYDGKIFNNLLISLTGEKVIWK